MCFPMKRVRAETRGGGGRARRSAGFGCQRMVGLAQAAERNPVAVAVAGLAGWPGVRISSVCRGGGGLDEEAVFEERLDGPEEV